MIIHTCFNATSFHKHSPKVLKSGICKYFRRQESVKFKWCVMEMSLFYDHEKGKALVTNLINRLKILLMEDLSCGEVYRIRRGYELLRDYDEDRSNRGLLLEFCDLVSEGKKNRITSYMNSWWRNKEVVCSDLTLDKVLKYKKKGDTDELLLLGENLIHFIENDDESMFTIFNAMIRCTDPQGVRYRRKEASYLWFSIIEDYLWNEDLKVIFKFALEMFMRTGMKERPAFGIWIGFICWKRDILDYSTKVTEEKQGFDEYITRMGNIEIDDYVINDYHVNKGFGLQKFAEEGAFVKEEDLSLLDNGPSYKLHYIEEKTIQDSNPKKVDKKVNKKVNKKVDFDSLHKIPFEEFSNVKVLEEGVCGGKVCCISVSYKGKSFILKEMKETMNYGSDYIVADECKDMFDLWSMNMVRIVSSMKLAKKDIQKKTFVNNWKLENQDAVYCMMDYFDNVGDLGKNKEFLDQEWIMRECLKIRLFDGLFRSSDNILRNILVNKDGELLSIDEGDLFGKRLSIFNQTDFINSGRVKEELLNEVIDDILSNGSKKKDEICKIMNLYKLDHHIDEFLKRFDSYRSIVMGEWK